MNILEALTPEARDQIVRDILLEDLDLADNSEVFVAMQKVIAYYSVPGTYENGTYDVE